MHSKKNAGLFQPKFGSNVDKPKCWVKKFKLKVEVGLNFCNCIFNPTFGFVDISPKV